MISVFLFMPLYVIGIQHQRGGLWYVVAPFTLVVLLLDLVLNCAELTAPTWDWPKCGEWRGDLARYIARCPDAIAPIGKLIE